MNLHRAILVPLLVLAAACARGDAEPARVTRPARFAPLEGTVSFWFEEAAERRPGAQPVPYLKTETEDLFACGATLWQEARLTGHELRVRIDGADAGGVPSGCAPAWGASALTLAPGTYDLVFAYRQWTDRYTLTVTRDRIQVGPGDGHFTHAQIPLIWRLPRNSFAVYCHTQRPEELGRRCGELADELGRLDGIARISFPPGGADPFDPQGAYSERQPLAAYYYRFDGGRTLHRARNVLDRIARRGQDRGETRMWMHLRPWTGDDHEPCMGPCGWLAF
jgi:hypothetical protein